MKNQKLISEYKRQNLELVELAENVGYNTAIANLIDDLSNSEAGSMIRIDVLMDKLVEKLK